MLQTPEAGKQDDTLQGRRAAQSACHCGLDRWASKSRPERLLEHRSSIYTGLPRNQCLDKNLARQCGQRTCQQRILDKPLLRLKRVYLLAFDAQLECALDLLEFQNFGACYQT